MPRGRMLNKKISYDERIARLSVDAALLYTWCIPHLDVKGRIYGDACILKGLVVPYIDELTIDKIDKCIKEFVGVDLVLHYGRDRKYMQFKGFDKNQKIYEDKESPSEIPEHGSNSRVTLEELPSNSRVTLEELPSNSRLSKVKESKVNIYVQNFDEIWNAYPKRVGKKAALKHFKASIKTAKDLENIKVALKHYLVSENVSKGYVQNGSTWFNNWEDWVNYEEKFCAKCKNKGTYTSATGYKIKCDCGIGSK